MLSDTTFYVQSYLDQFPPLVTADLMDDLALHGSEMLADADFWESLDITLEVVLANPGLDGDALYSKVQMAIHQKYGFNRFQQVVAAIFARLA